jgi:serine/threonine protein kinase
MNISHRDIKPQNVLVFYKSNEYKLADFGEAKELMKNTCYTNKQTLRGTELYMSPILFQALRSQQFLKYVHHNTFKSDVFSFGLCILFAASLCYESLYDIRELTSNFSIRIVIEKYLKRKYSSKLIDILCLMLELDEKVRCDFLELEKIFENM